MSMFRQFYKLWLGCFLGNIFLFFIVICMISEWHDNVNVDNNSDISMKNLNYIVFPLFAFSCHNTVPDIFQVFIIIPIKSNENY